MRSFLQNSLSKKAAGLLLGAALCLFGSEAFATTYTLKAGLKTWNSNGSWTPSGVPTASDEVIIPIGATASIISGEVMSCSNMRIQGTLNNAGSLTVGTSGTLVEGNFNNTGTFSTSGNMIVSPGVLSLGGTANNSFTTSGWVDFGSNGTLVLDNTNFTTIPNGSNYGNISIQSTPAAGMALQRDLTLAGTLTIFNGKKLVVSSNSLLTASTVSLQSAAEIEIVNNSNVAFASYIVDPSSTINYSGTGGTVKGGDYGILKVAGNTTLVGNATVSGSLNLTNGSISLGTSNLTIKSTGSITGNSISNYVKIGTGKLIIDNIGSGGKTTEVLFPIGTTNYTPATITNTGIAQSFTVTLSDGVKSNGAAGTVISDKVVNKTWEVSRTNGNTTPANVSLKLQWNAADQGVGFTPSVCVVSHYDGANWETTGTTAKGATLVSGTLGNGDEVYSLTRSGITSFSPFGVGGYLSPLPVELVSFAATKKAGEVALAWETASEKNNAGFEVQVSADGKHYEALAFVASKNGNSAAAQRYAFTHKTANKEGLVYYRLKQTDLNGESEYYTAKVVDLGRITATVSTFPNPFQDRFELNLTAAASTMADIQVVDMTGKTVYAAKQQVNKGANTITVELKNQPAGIYLLKTAAANQTYTNRLVKQ